MSICRNKHCDHSIDFDVPSLHGRKKVLTN